MLAVVIFMSAFALIAYAVDKMTDEQVRKIL